MSLRNTLPLLLISGASAMAGDDPHARLLFAFDQPESAKAWQTVNDGVMGGRSDGRFKINKAGNMEFSGTLSLENNGGFASVRSRGRDLGLAAGDTLIARIRGDGRQYTFNLYTPSRRTAFSYRAICPTIKDAWIEVELPLESFVATSFGRVVPNQPLNPGVVNGVGILLGDKKAGPFELEVEWIKVRSGDRVAAAIMVRRDVAYVDQGDAMQKLDVYAPTEGSNHPVVCWIHGGGWQSGDKADVQVKPAAFVRAGLVFISINYRLLPDGTIREMGEDVAKAIHWIHDHAQDYGGNPNGMFVMGHSAGAVGGVGMYRRAVPAGRGDSTVGDQGLRPRRRRHLRRAAASSDGRGASRRDLSPQIRRRREPAGPITGDSRRG